MNNCLNCKFYNEDYDFDEETGEEYSVYTCAKGKETNTNYKCEDFKRYKPRKYVEKDTMCDRCENVEICKKLSGSIDCTTIGDSKSHIICGRDYCTKSDATYAEEIIRRRIAGLSDEEIVQTINREHTKRLVELMKEQGMTLSDYEISICKELGIGF